MSIVWNSHHIRTALGNCKRNGSLYCFCDHSINKLPKLKVFFSEIHCLLHSMIRFVELPFAKVPLPYIDDSSHATVQYGCNYSHMSQTCLMVVQSVQSSATYIIQNKSWALETLLRNRTTLAPVHGNLPSSPQDMSRIVFGPIWAFKPGLIIYTHKIEVWLSLNTFRVNQVETFLQTRRKPENIYIDLFLNFLQKRQKSEFWLTLSDFGVN